VQDTFMRAWRSRDRFEGRASMLSWLYRIATNVCLDMLRGKERRVRPADIGPGQKAGGAKLKNSGGPRWGCASPGNTDRAEGDPAEVTVARESVRLALIAALQRLPARQHAALILRDVLRWEASEVAELLDASVASVNSALQRARATLARSNLSSTDPTPPLNDADRALLERYVVAFQRYDFDGLTSLIREDATQS